MDKEFIENPVEAYEKLKQKCEELTSKCGQLEENFKETADGLLKIQYALADHCNKYSKTLAEIKELCNKTLCDYLQCSLNYNHSKDFECEKTSCNRAKRRKFILEIIQKINEVEDEKNNS